ncbi:hypothetical protein ILYODFUR_034591 [Ilyodon furcidens]|uniref:Uncharacterized protein n=1 Tax=Ilyodon furcidens TaxID=33524 RepID=A0ABV0ST97_9TELE
MACTRRIQSSSDPPCSPRRSSPPPHPRLPTSPQSRKTTIPEARMQYSQSKASQFPVLNPALKKTIDLGWVRQRQVFIQINIGPPRSLGDERDDGTTAERTSRLLTESWLIDS